MYGTTSFASRASVKYTVSNEFSTRHKKIKKDRYIMTSLMHISHRVCVCVWADLLDFLFFCHAHPLQEMSVFFLVLVVKWMKIRISSFLHISHKSMFFIGFMCVYVWVFKFNIFRIIKMAIFLTSLLDTENVYVQHMKCNFQWPHQSFKSVKLSSAQGHWLGKKNGKSFARFLLNKFFSLDAQIWAIQTRFADLTKSLIFLLTFVRLSQSK